MSNLGVLHHDTPYRFLICVLCLLGILSLLSCTAYAEPDALPGIVLRPQVDLNTDDIEALGASGIALVLENARMTQQSTVTATLYGYPDSDYYVWFTDTQKMTGQYGDQPPQFSQNQAAVYHDAPNGPFTIGSYVFSQGGGVSIKENVAGAPSNGVLHYAQVRTGSNGQATITFTASGGTKPGLYIVRAERFTQGQYEIAHVPLEVLEKQGGVSLTTEKERVSAGEDIILTFTGQPSKYYILWVMNTGSMSGGPEDQPPLLLSDQVNVWRDPVHGPYDIGQYRCDTCRDLTLQQSVAQSPDSGTRYYARVMTDTLGFGTVTFSQTNLIKPQEYTFRIEEPFAAVTSSAEVEVQIQSHPSPTPTLSLLASQASVRQGEQFYVELWGEPKTSYYLWLLHTNTMDGTFGHQPPSIAQAQTLMRHDPILGPYTIGEYQYYGGGGKRIRDTIAINSEYRGTYYYGSVETDVSGYARVILNTNAGTEARSYTIRAELPLLMGGIQGAAFAETGVRVEATAGSLTITPENEHITLGSSSYIIITGLPNTEYYLWFYNTNHMSGYPGDQPPTFKEHQSQLRQDPSYGPYTIGNYAYADACCGRVIQNDVPSRPDNGIKYYGLVTTDAMGRAIIGFNTEYMVTKPGNYQIHVERNTGSGFQKATIVITVGSGIPPTPVPTWTPWPTPTHAPTWTPTPIPPHPRLTLVTDTSVLNPGETGTITLSGQPLTGYYFWVYDTAHLSGFYGDQPLVIPGGQQGIYQDSAQNIVIGKHHIEGRGRLTIHNDVPSHPENGTCYYALVTTDRMGIAQIKIQALHGVRVQDYILRAERIAPPAQPEIATTTVTVAGAPSPGFTLSVQPVTSPLGSVLQAHVRGAPFATYYLWISGTHLMSGLPGDQPPLIPAQPSIAQDGIAGPFFIGDYRYLGGNGRTIRDDVPIQPESGVRYYAQVRTDEQGQASFSLVTSGDTKPGEYTLTAQVQLTRSLEAEYEIERSNQITATARFSVHASGQRSFPLQLLQGWNFISIPGMLVPGNDTFAIFSNVDTSGRSIWAYDPAKWPLTQGWHTVSIHDPIYPLHGYWIYSTAQATVLIPLSDIIPMGDGSYTSPYDKHLYAGWNAIGVFGEYQRSAKDVLSSVSRDWTIVLGYDSASQRYDTSIINGGSGEYADDRFMMPGSGYWVFMQNPGTLFG